MPFSFLSYSCSLHQCVRSTFKVYPTSEHILTLLLPFGPQPPTLQLPGLQKKCPGVYPGGLPHGLPCIFPRALMCFQKSEQGPNPPVCWHLAPKPPVCWHLASSPSPSPHPVYRVYMVSHSPTLSFTPSSKSCWLLAIVPQHQADYQLRALAPLVLLPGTFVPKHTSCPCITENFAD